MAASREAMDDLRRILAGRAAFYSKAEFHERLNVVGRVERHLLSPAGHMLHHDQPEQLAQLIEQFISNTST